MTLVFDPATVYGSREGCHQALIITSRDKGNVYLKSALLKTSVATGIGMLARGEMLKVEKGNKHFGSESRLTKVQEMKQAGSPFLACHFIVNVELVNQLFSNQIDSTFLWQYLGGTSIVEKVLQSLIGSGGNSTPTYNVVIDLLGYDAWPAAWVLGQSSQG